jgi:hypothetical protein
MLRVRLGPRRYIGDEELDDPVLRRSLVGWDPTMGPGETALAARGWWRIGEKADGEKYAAVVGGGVIRMVLTIERWHTRDDGRRAFDGEILPDDHPVAARLVGREDPLPAMARNPVGYFADPSDLRACACGCGTPVRGIWVPGHDQQALHRTIAENWGTTYEFITWCRAKGMEVPPPPGSSAKTVTVSSVPAPTLAPDITNANIDSTGDSELAERPSI